jgi:hypothetical protein
MNQKILMNTNFLRKNKKEKENETTKKLPHSTCANWKCRRLQIIWRFSWSILAVISSDHGDLGSNHDPKRQTTGHFEVPKIWALVMNGSSCWFLEFHNGPNGSIFGGIWWLPSTMANGWLLPIGRKLLSICWYTTEVFIGFCLKTQDWWWATTGHNPTRHSSVYVLIPSSCGERPALGSLNTWNVPLLVAWNEMCMWLQFQTQLTNVPSQAESTRKPLGLENRPPSQKKPWLLRQ